MPAKDDSDATMSDVCAVRTPPLRDSMENFGADSRRLVQAIRGLDELNINATLQLTKFVVVGDQSAGKSSIVGALCGISFPRSQETCNR
jgi:hypothetical protein